MMAMTISSSMSVNAPVRSPGDGTRQRLSMLACMVRDNTPKSTRCRGIRHRNFQRSTGSIRQHLQFADSSVGQLPATAPPDHQVAAGIGPFLIFVDGEQLEPAAAMDFRGGARHQGKGHAVVIQGDFVTRHAFLFGAWGWAGPAWGSVSNNENSSSAPTRGKARSGRGGNSTG